MTISRTVLYENCDKTKPVIVNAGDPNDPATWSYNTPNGAVWAGDPATLGGAGGGATSDEHLSYVASEGNKGGYLVHPPFARIGITDDPTRVTGPAVDVSTTGLAVGDPLTTTDTQTVVIDVDGTCPRLELEYGLSQSGTFFGQIACRGQWSLVPTGSPSVWVDFVTGGGDQLQNTYNNSFLIAPEPGSTGVTRFGEFSFTEHDWAPPLAAGTYDLTMQIKYHNAGAGEDGRDFGVNRIDGCAVVQRFITQ